MNNFFILILFFLTVTVCANAQDCNCESNFTWVKTTFEQSDAGFKYVIDRKGGVAYNAHNKQIENRIKSAQNIYDCAEIIREWLYFFRKGHIGIDILNNDTLNNNFVNQQDTMQFFSDWETLSVDTVEFKHYLANKKDIDFEGIWNYDPYIIGVKKVDENYIGFIIDSQNDMWKQWQIKFKIYPDSAVYYMENHTPQKEKFMYMGKNIIYLKHQNDGMIRMFPKYEDKFSQSILNNQPYCEKINQNTVYLRIPSFANNFKKSVDSIVITNLKLITSTENLIIDVRFNGGGSDACWQNIMPFIYTNPIRMRNCYFLATNLSIQQYSQYLDSDFVKQLENNIGKFVLLRNEKYSVSTYNSYELPKKVAIIINDICASATEDFLLAARQSQKVKIFGTNTYGALDFANMCFAVSPNNDIKLWYAFSKDADIENYPIDGIGIQPDYYLDNEIPEYQWVDYVTKILNYTTP